MAKKIVKAALCLVVAAAIAAAGYYMGYSNHASSIISAIPKQSFTGKETPPGFIGEKGLIPSPDIQGEPNSGETPSETSDAGKYIGKSESSAAGSTWSKLDSYECDISADNSEETINLYTSAETSDGEILWDDSQKWVLEVQAEDGVYTLLNQNISNGRVYFDVDEVNNNTYAITVYTVSSAGTNIKQYTYSKTGFIEKQVYAAASINNLHSGIPAYK